MVRNYWMVVWSPENFQASRGLGFRVHGLHAYHKRKVQRMEPGDRLLYYIGRIRCFGATATLTSRYFEDHSNRWKPEGFSPWAFGVNIRPEVVLDDNQLADAHHLAPRLDYVRRWPPESWYIAFAQSDLHILPKRDFTLIEEELKKLRASDFRPPSRTISLSDPAGSRCRLYPRPEELQGALTGGSSATPGAGPSA